MRKRAIARLKELMKRDHCTNCGGHMRDGQCDTCGYEIVEQMKEKVSAAGHPPY